MNSNRRVLQFVTGSVSIYLLISIVSIVFDAQWTPLKRVNLVSEMVMSPEISNPVITKPDSNVVVIEKAPEKDFDLYKEQRSITSFNVDHGQPSLVSFLEKLYQLKAGKKTKIRIAYFGDSMIEGDLLTQTVRKLLQQEFGGSGVGFVPITSQVSKFRQSVSHTYSDGWKDESFKTGKTNKLYLSGHLFRSSGDWVQMLDQTITDSIALIEKSLLCGNPGASVNISVNNGPFIVNAPNILNRIVLGTDRNKGIKLAVSDERLPVYGVSFESPSGIFVDNFSFRGITGIEFASIDSAFMSAIAANNPYDLIIFQYGVNLLFRPNDRNFNWYAKAMLPVVKKIKNCFAASDFLLVSTADRAFRYGGEYRSAVGIDSLIRIQATIAYETGSSFYNQFASMGGTNSIVEWAKRDPSLANKDYVHPNHRGAEVLGGYLYEALMAEYNKYIHTRK